MLKLARLFCLALLLITASAGLSKLQAEEYDLKLDRPFKTGQQFRMASSLTDSKDLQLFINGKLSKTDKERTTFEYEADVTVLEVDDTGNSVSEQHRVIRCEAIDSNGRKALIPAGKLLKVSAIGKTFTYSIDNAEMPSIGKFNDDLIAPLKNGRSEKLMGLNSKRRLGESWPIDTEQLNSELGGKDMVFAKDSISGEAGLTEKGKQGAIEYLLFEGKLKADRIEKQIMPELKTDHSSMLVTFSSKLPTNHALLPLQTKRKMVLDLTASGKPEADGIVFEMSIIMHAEISLTRDYKY